MENLRNTFLASQDEFFDVVERRFGDLENRMRDCEALVESLARASDHLAQRAILLSQRAEPPVAWTFDARMPNLYFSGLYEVETKGGMAKRWVGPSCQFGGRLLLDRRYQYLVEVKVVDFITPEAEASFCLVVDGHKRPWHSASDRLFTTLVAEAPDETALDFRLEIDPQGKPEDSDVSFSFQRVSFRRDG